MGEKISRCLIGAKYTQEVNELNELGIDAVLLQGNPLLDEEIRYHADILAFSPSQGLLIADKHSAGELSSILTDYEVKEAEDIKSPYPGDVKLNASILGNRIVCNKKYADKSIIEYAEKNNIEIISTKQGYAKCNMCILNDRAVITEDDGICTLLKNYQIDILKISKGFVHLSDKHYGFIGGASAVISDSEIYFSGDVSAHPDYDEILCFLNKYGFKAVFNQNRKLTDFGGIIQI